MELMFNIESIQSKSDPLVVYCGDPGCGDSEDLEQHELLASARAPALIEGSSARGASPDDEKTQLKANCHFREVTADDAKPSTNKPPSVLGVFIVATKPIAAGEPLLVSYGREFWSGWAQRKARLGDLENAASTSSKQRSATAKPEIHPSCLATKWAVAWAPSAMVASEVMSPNSPRSSASAAERKPSRSMI